MRLVMIPLLAAKDWPDALDRSAIIVYLLVIISIPILGYWIMVIDLRAYLWALRGVLVRVVHVTVQSDVPEWVRDETPPCLRAMGLSLPCTEDDLKQAYRRLAKRLHPDRGGQVQRFLLLQEHFEQSKRFLRQRETRRPSHPGV